MLRSRKKYGPVVGAILFLFASFFFFWVGMGLERVAGKFLCLILSTASIGVLFFCVVSFVHLKRSKFLGFFISSDGFNDNSTGHGYGMVLWKDVVKIRIVDDLEHGWRYICLKVKNPYEYIGREPLQHKRRSLELKFQYYGSPICFSNRGLNCTFQELEDTIRSYYGNYLQREKEKNVGIS